MLPRSDTTVRLRAKHDTTQIKYLFSPTPSKISRDVVYEWKEQHAGKKETFKKAKWMENITVSYTITGKMCPAKWNALDWILKNGYSSGQQIEHAYYLECVKNPSQTYEMVIVKKVTVDTDKGDWRVGDQWDVDPETVALNEWYPKDTNGAGNDWGDNIISYQIVLLVIERVWGY